MAKEYLLKEGGGHEKTSHAKGSRKKIDTEICRGEGNKSGEQGRGSDIIEHLETKVEIIS